MCNIFESGIIKKKSFNGTIVKCAWKKVASSYNDHKTQ